MLYVLYHPEEYFRKHASLCCPSASGSALFVFPLPRVLRCATQGFPHVDGLSMAWGPTVACNEIFTLFLNKLKVNYFFQEKGA